MLEIYTRNGCPYCEKLKLILESFDVTFVSQNLDDNFTREEFYEKFGDGSTFPQVTMNDISLGGCTNTIKYLQEKDICCRV